MTLNPRDLSVLIMASVFWCIYSVSMRDKLQSFLRDHQLELPNAAVDALTADIKRFNTLTKVSVGTVLVLLLIQLLLNWVYPVTA